MENDFRNMGNSEIKLCLNKIKDEYDVKKRKIILLCEEMSKLESEYKRGEEELKIRKNILF